MSGTGGGAEPRPAAGDLTVVDVEPLADGTPVQRQVRAEDPARVLDQTLEFAPDAVRLRRYSVQVPVVNQLRTFTCDTDDPVVVMPSNVSKGAPPWGGETTCRQGATLSYTAAFVALEDVPIPGRDVMAAAHLHVHVSVKPAADTSAGFAFESDLEVWYSPDLHLAVKQTETTSGHLGEYRLTRQGEDVLSGLP